MNKMREFKTGATRDIEEGKLDYEGFFHPLVLKEFAKYMEKHRHTANGDRDSDNWQNGFGDKHYDVCMKSLLRHVMDLWLEHRGFKSRDGIENALMGTMFNVMAYAYKFYKEKGDDKK